MTTNVTIPTLPAGVIPVSSMDGLNALAQVSGGVVFIYSHLINPTLRATWSLVPYAGIWYGFVIEGPA
jgi:hypothetical protein